MQLSAENCPQNVHDAIHFLHIRRHLFYAHFLNFFSGILPNTESKYLLTKKTAITVYVCDISLWAKISLAWMIAVGMFYLFLKRITRE